MAGGRSPRRIPFARTCKTHSGTKGRIAVAELGEVVLADAPVGLPACYHSRSPLAVKADADGPHCHFFPLLANQDVALLLEMRLGKPLSEYALRLVAGMLRIYRNHLQVLHESDYDALTGLLNHEELDDYFRRQDLTRTDTRSGQRPVRIPW